MNTSNTARFRSAPDAAAKLGVAGGIALILTIDRAVDRGVGGATADGRRLRRGAMSAAASTAAVSPRRNEGAEAPAGMAC